MYRLIGHSWRAPPWPRFLFKNCAFSLAADGVGAAGTLSCFERVFTVTPQGVGVSQNLNYM